MRSIARAALLVIGLAALAYGAIRHALRWVPDDEYGDPTLPREGRQSADPFFG